MTPINLQSSKTSKGFITSSQLLMVTSSINVIVFHSLFWRKFLCAITRYTVHYLSLRIHGGLVKSIKLQLTSFFSFEFVMISRHFLTFRIYVLPSLQGETYVLFIIPFQNNTDFCVFNITSCTHLSELHIFSFPYIFLISDNIFRYRCNFPLNAILQYCYTLKQNKILT